MIRVTGIRSSAWRVSGPIVSMNAASPAVLGNWPGVGHEPGRRLVAEDAVEERGHADRAADVGAEPDRRAAGADRRALAARGAARGAVRVVGVAGAAVDAVDRLDPHRHLGRVGHAEGDEAGVDQPLHGGRVGVGAAVASAPRARRSSACPATAIDSLTVQGTPRKGGRSLPAGGGDSRVGRVGLGQRVGEAVAGQRVGARLAVCRRSTCAWTTSRADTSLARIALASSVALRRVSAGAGEVMAIREPSRIPAPARRAARW